MFTRGTVTILLNVSFKVSVRLTTQEREREREREREEEGSKGVKVGKEGGREGGRRGRGGNDDRKERKGEKRVGEGGEKEEEPVSLQIKALSPHPIISRYHMNTSS